MMEILKELPLWLLVCFSVVIMACFLYAVVTDREVNLWGFKIGKKNSNTENEIYTPKVPHTNLNQAIEYSDSCDLTGLVDIARSIEATNVYVCATSSVPIAAVLMLKGISPGAALVFLMAGPATNAATITVIGKTLGRKTLISYIATLIAGALTFGLLIDNVIPGDFIINGIIAEHGSHTHGILPEWIKVSSGAIMVLLVINIYIQRFIKWRNKRISSKSAGIETEKQIKTKKMKIAVKGMTCNHCKMNVEKGIGEIAGVKSVNADIGKGEVTLEGENIDMDKVRSAVENAGYGYEGLAG